MVRSSETIAVSPWMLVTLSCRSTVIATLVAMTFLVSPDRSALLLSRVARPL